MAMMPCRLIGMNHLGVYGVGLRSSCQHNPVAVFLGAVGLLARVKGVILNYINNALSGPWPEALDKVKIRVAKGAKF
jgi:hypothetical protein